ncbi:hypothetical protein [Geobacter sp. OR-1]|uniref:hypothetical protein n=1 Tax=Geobacter sp. OR-1 TaxID=1266765 RepID=UPI001364987D|nr:hypothetical protein [Geobacter sp. OR-1]
MSIVKKTYEAKQMIDIVKSTAIGRYIWDEINNNSKSNVINIGFTFNESVLGSGNRGLARINNNNEIDIIIDADRTRNPVETALIFVHEASHVLMKLNKDYSCGQRITQEKYARSMESEMWEQLGKPSIENDKSWMWELRHPSSSASIQTLLRDCW